MNDVRTTFLTQLVASPEGRQHMLSISVEAEEGDEAGVFDQLEGVVDDPKLQRMVTRHRDDEARHARLFRGCLDRLGLELQPIPDELKIIHQVALATGEVNPEISSAEDIVRTYALLFAIEERGVEQFPFIADAFRAVDPETSEVYLRVAKDERGHLRFCETIGRHYAADDRVWDDAVGEARVLEESAFLGVGLANIAYCGEQGWIEPAVVLGSAG